MEDSNLKEINPYGFLEFEDLSFLYGDDHCVKDVRTHIYSLTLHSRVVDDIVEGGDYDWNGEKKQWWRWRAR